MWTADKKRECVQHEFSICDHIILTIMLLMSQLRLAFAKWLRYL